MSSELIPFDRGRRKRKPSAAPASSQFTDIGNAQEFAEYHAGSFRHVPERGVWVRWDGKRWALARQTDLLAAAKEVLDALLLAAANEPNELRRDAWIKHILKSCSVGKMEAMIKLAASASEIQTPAAAFDTHPHLFNCGNGVIDLRTGELYPHDRALFITKLAPLDYDPTAAAPRWEQFFLEVFASSADLVAYMRKAVGYSLTGETGEHAFFIPYGKGANGKGRFMRQVQKVAGEYAVTTSIETFTGKRDNPSGATPELAALAGARLVAAGEAEAGARLSEGLIKSLTGDDPITCRRLFEEPFTFRPEFKLWMHTNHKPVVRGTDEGIWRRPRLIPFTVSFLGREDKQLDAKLDREAAGIFAWCIEGARRWYAEGLGTVEAVARATADYREESDALLPFIEAALDVRPEGRISRKRLFQLYAAWCERTGEEPMKAATVYRLIEARGGIEGTKYAGERGFKGIEERQS